MCSVENFTGNLKFIKDKIAKAAARVKRNPDSVRIMAVTKTFPAEAVRTARSCGIRLFGENRVQEAAAKYSSLDFKPELHLIGHLQRNKVKTAVGLFDCIESVDKLETALAIDKESAFIDKTSAILVEINTSGEESKFGIRDENAYFSLLDHLLELQHIQIRGLMTVGPFTEDVAESRRAFIRLRNLFLKTRERYALQEFDCLSMGMSSDFEVAIEEGSSLIRIGTALFGSR